jgi:predicted N-acetyltransferase YhbS
MKGAFHIRAATADDIPALRRLVERSVRELGREHYSAEEMDGSLQHVLGLDTQLIDDQTYFVASPDSDAGMIAGCGGWSYRKTLCGSDQAPNREMTSLDPATDAARIRAIFVHPDWARRGLGSLLLKHCEDAATRAGFCRFEMGSTLTGVPLYALQGYKACERVDIPLRNGAVLFVLRMTKDL